MKNSYKRTMIYVLAFALASVLTLNAFAVSRNSSGTFGLDKFDYHGNYSAFMDVSAESATISLSITDYVGPVLLDNGVQIQIDATLKDCYGKIYTDSDTLPSVDSTSYTWHITPGVDGTKFVDVKCTFYYMYNYVTSHTVTVG